ncbi:MAG: hypothetical protein HYX74_11370 [Acidobacteria bacterium]|nr:hypothetical protein [Acidobacteriota bacterium]
MKHFPFYKLAVALFACLGGTMAMLPAYVSDRSVQQPPDYFGFFPPAAGGSYLDPVFGTGIKRITDALATPNLDRGGNLTFANGEYSTMSPFNRDNSRILVVFQSYFALYDGNGSFLKTLPFEISASSEPRWSRTDASLLYYRVGNQLKQYNVDTGAVGIVRIFSEYSTISGRGESDISFDGNHFVLVGDNRYVFVYEISRDIKGPVLDTAGRGFDSVYITPDNNVTVTWLQAGNSRYNGIELYDRNMLFLRQLARAGGHMDVTRDINGDEVLVWTNSADPLPVCDNGIVKIRLADGRQTCLLSLDWSLAVHISGPDNGGWVFIDTYAPADPSPQSPSWVPYTNEILQIKLDGTEVRRLAHQRSRPFNSYNFQPRVSVSRDGSRLVYSSNYGLQATLGYPSEYSDVYLASVGASSVGTGTGPVSDGGDAGSGGDTGSSTDTGSGDTTGGSGVSSSTRVEQDGASVTYSGAWYANNLALHSGGSAALSVDAGSRVIFSFSGTAVSWIGYRDEWSGIADVYLDGRLQATVDTFSSPARSQTVLFSATSLPAGNHTLVVQATGKRNSLSGGAWIWVDAFDASGSSSEPSAGGSGDNGAAGGLIEQDSTAIKYGGGWYANNLAVHSGGGAALAMDGATRATLTFTGTAVRWIGYRDPWSGIANVYVDGKKAAVVDTYSATDQAQAVLYAATGLSAGTHTLAVEVAGRKNRNARGTWVWIDAFQVSP